MNTKNRGTEQNESLVIRVTAEDKSLVRLAAQRAGLSMSDIIRNALMETNVIKPVYPHF